MSNFGIKSCVTCRFYSFSLDVDFSRCRINKRKGRFSKKLDIPCNSYIPFKYTQLTINFDEK